MGQAEQEFPWLARQLSWDERSDSVFSHLSSEESHGSSESLNDQIEEVTSDLKDMLREVEVLKVSFFIKFFSYSMVECRGPLSSTTV